MLNLFPGYRFPRRLFRFLLPFVLIGVFVGYQAVEASDITYIYDELGRGGGGSVGGHCCLHL